jgi:hypothetical protein
VSAGPHARCMHADRLSDAEKSNAGVPHRWLSFSHGWYWLGGSLVRCAMFNVQCSCCCYSRASTQGRYGGGRRRSGRQNEGPTLPRLMTFVVCSAALISLAPTARLTTSSQHSTFSILSAARRRCDEHPSSSRGAPRSATNQGRGARQPGDSPRLCGRSAG